MTRQLTAIVAGVLLALLAAPAVAAKDAVRARLISPVDLDARAGERIRIAWTLEDARGHPFGASGLFVRLRSAGTGKPVTAVTEGGGRFTVDMTVPEGGIGRIEFGLRGSRIVRGRESRSDILFPLTNDPLASPRTGRARLSPGSAPALRDDDAIPLWVAFLGALGAAGAVVGVSLLVRRSSAEPPA